MIGSPSRRAAAAVVALVLAAQAACVTPSVVSRAETAYQQGRYLEAAESLARHESSVEDMPRNNRARYGLYRGLALMELGDPAAGRRWLYYARDVELEEPTLNDRQRQELQEGLAALSAP